MNRSHKSVAVAPLAVVEALGGGMPQAYTASAGGAAITNMTNMTMIDLHSHCRRNAWTSQ